MYCTNCGNHNDSISSYCIACGMPVGGGAATMAPGRAYDAYRYEAKRESALGAAWRDITDTPGWWKKSLFLCLISCIPIVNLAVDGFALRWSRDLSFDKNEPLPKAVFKKKEILTGFRALLLNIIYGIVFMLASFAVSTVVTGFFASINQGLGAAMGIVLTVLSLVAYLFIYWPMVNASTMRMTIVDHLESGLNFQKVWNVFRRSPGGAIGATIIPSLVAALVQFVLVVIFFAIIGAVLQSAANNYLDMIGGYGYMSYMIDPYSLIDDSLSYAYNLGNLATVLMIVMFIAAGMVSMFAKMLTWRAMGHWAAETATEWPFESDEEDAVQRFESQATVQNTVAPRNASDVKRPRNDMFAEAGNWNRGNTPSTQIADTRNSARNNAYMHQANNAVDLDDATIVSPKQLVKGISLVHISTKATYEVSSLPTVIGKGSASDVVIDCARSISRTHARIAFDGSSITIEDLKSTNGTMINGEPIPAHVPTAIQEGDIVSLSDEDFRVVLK
ncbi:MAG: FHA domain-containing protein [Eggerthellaceae bacterium]|nr:FHA domain-containing protein [Eggerthellaceae bacterium]